MSSEDLRRQLYAAFKNRAMMYWHIYQALKIEIGDKGTFEGAGFNFSMETWKAGQQGCCLMKIKPGK